MEGHVNSIEHIFLVDDYIGSGETGLKALTYLKDHGFECDKLSILALAVQKDGKELLEAAGVPVISEVVRSKGIEMVYPRPEWGKRRHQMKMIGRKLRVKDKNCYLGRGDVEGLITMNRTPNNTFPFYWYEDDGRTTYAPFPRMTVRMINQ